MGLKIKKLNKDEWIELTIAELQTSRIDKINKVITIRGVRYDLRTAQETEAKGGTSQTNAMYTYKVDKIFNTTKDIEEIMSLLNVGTKVFAIKEKKFYIKDNTAIQPIASYNSKILETTNDHLITVVENAQTYLIDTKSPKDLQRILAVREYSVNNEGEVSNVLPNGNVLVFKNGVLEPIKRADGTNPQENDVVKHVAGKAVWAASSTGGTQTSN